MKNRFKNQDSGDDGDDNAWIFSYADMISLVLGFFIIMFSMSTLEEDKLEEFSRQMRKSLAGKEDDKEAEAIVGVDDESRQLRALQLLVSVLNIGQNMDDAVRKIEEIAEESADAEAAKEQLMEEMKDESDAMRTLVMRGNKQKDIVVEIALPTEMLFRPGGDELNPKAKFELKKLADALSTIDELVEIKVVGHTDSTTPSPRARYTNNWALSAARAGSVTKYLIESGINRDIVRSSGQADLQPLFPEYADDGKALVRNMAKNRRVQIIVKRRKNDT